MSIWANQVSPLQNWYPIIYIHNGMINSVHYADLGESGFVPTLDHWWARRVSPLHD